MQPCELFLLGACSVSSPLGGDASSEDGKAFIAAIKGKLYSDAAFTTEIPVEDNGDASLFQPAVRFAGAPSKTTAYYYLPESYHTPVGLPDKTMVMGLIIEGGGLYEAGPKKSADAIAKEMGFADANAAQNDSAKAGEFNKRVASRDNIDFNTKGNQRGYIKP